ncbi:HAD family hydrolase [Rummeliibacillus pycnus]|uniref:HAD family hydrolase n=1 Tax=Rummeliibacillus pycnus TaxID=101070 RepID=UPI0037C6FA05
MIKAVIFDLDGTLLNRKASVASFIENQYERLLVYLSHIQKDSYVKRFIELDNDGNVWKDKVYSQLINEYKISGMTTEDLLEDYLTEFKHHCKAFENLKEVLSQLKKQGLSIGMITNGFGQFQLDNIRALNIEEYFDVISISEWEGLKKPNPQIFERTLKKLGVKATESVFIGDHPKHDIEAAKSIGMIAIWKSELTYETVQADYIVNNLIEIPRIVQVMEKEKNSI